MYLAEQPHPFLIPDPLVRHDMQILATRNRELAALNRHDRAEAARHRKMYDRMLEVRLLLVENRRKAAQARRPA